MTTLGLRITHHASRIRYYAGLVLLAVLLAACGGRSGYTAEQQTVDGVTIKLEHPQRVKLLDNYELFVTLTGADGKPIDGATVYMEQDMPAMPMASNQPLGEPQGSGQYRLTGVFNMEGDWKLVIHASAAGKQYQAIFAQNVSPEP